MVDGGCYSFISKRSGRGMKATEDQMIMMNVWRIPHEKIGVNTLSERPEETVGVYAKDDCSIQAPTRTAALVITGCEDTLNVLGGCYACNKLGHVKRNCLNLNQPQKSYNKGPKCKFSCYNCKKQGHLVQDCHLPQKNRGREAFRTKERMKKICQEMMVQCNKNSGDFQ